MTTLSADWVLCCRCEDPVDIEVTYEGGKTGRCGKCKTVLWHKEWFEVSISTTGDQLTFPVDSPAASTAPASKPA
jgi:hypothetical protein